MDATRLTQATSAVPGQSSVPARAFLWRPALPTHTKEVSCASNPFTSRGRKGAAVLHVRARPDALVVDYAAACSGEFNGASPQSVSIKEPAMAVQDALGSTAGDQNRSPGDGRDPRATICSMFPEGAPCESVPALSISKTLILGDSINLRRPDPALAHIKPVRD
jgi:hypothetical protein